MAKTIKSRLEGVRKVLAEHGQEHLLRFGEDLAKDELLKLIEEIEKLDWKLIEELIAKYVRGKGQIELPHEILPPPVYLVEPADTAQREKYARALERGERLIAEHKVAAFTVAGGQGTRLNYNGPKGNVPATPLRNKPLFQVFAEQILAVQRRYNCVVPWYIMTAPANHEDTLRSFQENDYWGLKPADVMHFPQGTMPSFDFNGKMLLAEAGVIATNPDGHGGSLRALYNSGASADMARRGVEYISYFQVDNPIVYTVDPLFIGLHALDGAEMSSKAVRKAEPLEKVGNFTMADGKVTVIEYSDLPEELARKRLPDGRLAFEFGSIAIHIINRAFVERLNAHGFSLPWHRAVKKVSFVNERKELVTPPEPNAVKLETFVFDALPLAERSIILEVERGEQFAPIKNAAGVDSLQSSQQLQIARAAKWMEAAGIPVPRRPDGTPEVALEISPLFALDPHELADKRRQLRPLKTGDIVYLG